MAARLTAAERILRSISEAEWQSSVMAYARLNGWLVYHPPANVPSKNGGHIQHVVAGWPDLAFAREGEFFLAELKRETGKTTPDQDKWIATLRTAGVEVHVWKPSDDREMKERLRRRR